MKFTFTDSQTRIYPEITVSGAVLVAESGMTYDLEGDPGDGRWVSAGANVTTAPKAPETPLEAPESPATDEAAPTPETEA